MEAVGGGLGSIAAESVECAKRSVEAGGGAFERLAATKSLGKAVEIQAVFARSAFEGTVGQVIKVGQIVSNMAEAASRPHEAFFDKFGR